MTSAPQALMFDLPHLRVSALAWGPPDGRLILCLHGYPDTAWTWRRLGPLLAAQGYRVVAPFSRGYCPTEIPRDGDYHIGALMFDSIALHRHLDSPADAVLLGHDWGGFTAVALAAHDDSPFATVIALATPVLHGFRQGLGTRPLRRLPAQTRNSWYVVYQQLPGLTERTLDRVIPRLWRDWCPPGYDTSADLEYLWAALPDRAHRKAAVSYYRHQFQPRRQHPAYRPLHRSWRKAALRTPILLVHGEVDGALDVELASASAASLPAGSQHEIISGAGHFVQLDAPEQLSKLISRYVER
ncbi:MULTISPECIES: alpha/beta fold hydrolase [Mycobacterium]|uniref:Alpha/beta hydrolase n=1 Tax=Mycobacterium kiyosense TaxID=2871094 RepID=A0A9P3QAK5_9MYCO|nr:MULTISPECIES: alpha/beta hydrolase [Mycobacterium]BDB40175.1 alpha/beta hydrolase [Mycobacterium kiyosense]BDE12007.1 alpha/beta hydrolase [Mycobacterium sp. 20KCMC460]GLB84248.1 alpha/beta hydrolase [Mycobacterium kiyosense]GLB91668.1 alpha/beta hydrolase [Mycobacterium kiyosense]GLB97655.1 alpha/beta hydrolase [Mycobacterium kiyosense]